MFIIEGGSPLLVFDCAQLAGCKGAILVSQRALHRLERVYPAPRDGTFLRSAQTGSVFRIAGGAPLPVSDCAPLAGCKGTILVAQREIRRLERKYPAPFDGTFLRAAGTSNVFEFLGGAPLRIVDFREIPGWRNYVLVNQSAITRALRIRSFPRDGTYLFTVDTSHAYVVSGHALSQFNYCVAYRCSIKPNIDQQTIDKLAQTGAKTKQGTVPGDLLMLAAAGLLLAGFVIVSAFRPLIAVWALLVVFVVTQAVRDSYDPLLRLSHAHPGRYLGGYTIYTWDVVVAAFVAVAAFHLARGRIRNLGQGLAVALLVLLAIHIVRGIFAFDLQSAVNQGRPTLYFLAPIIFAATVPHGWDRRVWRPFAITCFLLFAIAIGYYIHDGFHSSTDIIVRNGVRQSTLRPINGVGALLMVELAAVLSVLRWPSRRIGVMLAAVAAIGVIALQIRTVWVIGVAIGLVALAVWLSRSLRRSRAIVAWAVGGLSLASALVVVGFLKSHALLTDIKTTTQSHGTFAWRITGWKELLVMHHSLKDILIGMPSGPIWTRTVFGVSTDVLPHSFYLELFLRFGLLGVLILVGMYLLLWRRRAEIAARLGITPLVVSLLLLTQLIYFFSYSPDVIQGMILGILVASLSAAAFRRPSAPTDQARLGERVSAR